jgi:hypothetical protein
MALAGALLAHWIVNNLVNTAPIETNLDALGPRNWYEQNGIKIVAQEREVWA